MTHKDFVLGIPQHKSAPAPGRTSRKRLLFVVPVLVSADNMNSFMPIMARLFRNPMVASVLGTGMKETLNNVVRGAADDVCAVEA